MGDIGTHAATLVYGFMIIGEKFPHTAARELEVSFGDMMLEIFRRPVFFIWFGAKPATGLPMGRLLDSSLNNDSGI